jgi:hypothetical protein
MPDWKTDLQNEFDMAQKARANGQEGQARVRARRAAGVALRETFRRRGIAFRNPSAYALLQEYMGFDDTPADLRQIAGYLTLRVTEAFELPLDVDLVQEAQTLCERLFPEEF